MSAANALPPAHTAAKQRLGRQPRLAVLAVVVVLALGAFSYTSGGISSFFYGNADEAQHKELRAEVEREVKARFEKLFEGRLADELDAARQQEVEALQARRICPVYKPGDNASFAFLHVPKTAGNLLVNTLAAMMPKDSPGRWCTRGQDGDLPEVYDTSSPGPPKARHTRLLNITMRNWMTKCSGFAAHQDSVFFKTVGVDPARTVTLVALRHPVDRAISDYYYSLKMKAYWLKRFQPQNESDFSGLLRFMEVNRYKLNNFATQLLGGGRHSDFPGVPLSEEDLGTSIEVAKRVLDETCVILLTEFMDESMLRLALAAGWSGNELMRVSGEVEAKSKAELGARVNAGPPKPHVPLSVRQAIAEYNSYDMQLYEYGVQLFLRRREAARSRRRKHPGL